MRICLLPTDLWGVGSYRTLLPGRELERHGHKVFLHIDQTRFRDWNAAQGNVPVANSIRFTEDMQHVVEDFDADVYVLQRRFEWFMPTVVRQLRRIGKVVVSETDDLYDGLPKSSPGWKVLRAHPKIFSIDRFNESLAFSDCVTVSTEALAEHYSRYNANVKVLPNLLDWSMWEDVEQQSEVEREGGRIRVGWMGWLAWRDRDLEVLRRFLPGWLRRHPNVDFVSIGEPERVPKGHVSVHDYLGVPKSQRLTVHARPFRQLHTILPHIDIGLVPLDMNQFNECKSYLKGLEYAACGVPSVASPTGPYRGFIESGRDGLLAADHREWDDALSVLVADDDLRRRMGRAAREKASRMTIEEGWPLWEQTYASLLSAASTASISDTSGSLSAPPGLASSTLA